MGQTAMSFMTVLQESYILVSAAFHWTLKTTIIQFRRVLHNYKEARMVGALSEVGTSVHPLALNDSHPFKMQNTLTPSQSTEVSPRS